MQVRNPRTGQYDYAISPPTHAELLEKTQTMRVAQTSWSALPIAERVKVLSAWKTQVEQHKSELIAALSIDTGRYRESVLEYELLPSSISRWQNWATEWFGQANEKMSVVPNIRIQQQSVPYPLVAVISPWNFPLLLSMIDTIPALLAGCAVVVKPSEITPRFIEVLQRTIDETPVLREVLWYTAGAGETGASLIELSDICCFTGSVATGRKVYQQAAALFKPCFLELGGKDAALVFAGANLEHAARSILWGSTVNCGHSCLSIERVYVQAEIFEEFTEKLVAEAEKVQLAYPSMNDGQIGPVISERQVAIINEHLQDALNRGAVLRTGSRACVEMDGGFYCRPTVLTGVRQDMKIIQEETFGPIIPLQSFGTQEEAIQLANDTIFGLSGAVFAEDHATALAIGRQMEAGAISINECALTALVHDGEKNSFKLSGLGGSRMGPASLQRFMRKKAYLINENAGASAWWF
jgi:acyl-CoA reductase-like NAD-dependent aldehyde dehydrogenase